MHRKEVTHSNGSYEKKSRRRAWLKKWDKVKSHGTLIDWCTGREWHVNCMTVISVWWRSNIPFQRLSGRLNYYITRWRQEVRELGTRFGDQRSWRQDVVEKATTQQKGPLGSPIEFGDQTSWWEDAGMRTCPRKAGPQGPRLSNPGERERHNADGHKSGGQYVAVFVQSPTPSHAQNLSNKVRGIYFFKVLARLY